MAKLSYWCPGACELFRIICACMGNSLSHWAPTCNHSYNLRMHQAVFCTALIIACAILSRIYCTQHPSSQINAQCRPRALLFCSASLYGYCGLFNVSKKGRILTCSVARKSFVAYVKPRAQSGSLTPCNARIPRGKLGLLEEVLRS